VIRAAALIAVVFGAATIFSGARVLFGDGAAGAGDYLPYIVWFNFLAGFAYVAAGIGLWRREPWAAAMSLALALLNALFFAALGGHIAAGAAYEMRTVAAMALRTVLWIGIAYISVLGCRGAANRTSGAFLPICRFSRD
jgi:FAD/FMN-containing dehydrogenase